MAFPAEISQKKSNSSTNQWLVNITYCMDHTLWYTTNHTPKKVTLVKPYLLFKLRNQFMMTISLISRYPMFLVKSGLSGFSNKFFAWANDIKILRDIHWAQSKFPNYFFTLWVCSLGEVAEQARGLWRKNPFRTVRTGFRRVILLVAEREYSSPIRGIQTSLWTNSMKGETQWSFEPAFFITIYYEYYYNFKY